MEDPLNKTAETAKIIQTPCDICEGSNHRFLLVYDAEDFTSESQEDARIVRLYEAFG
jgi:hypothetical protein